MRHQPSKVDGSILSPDESDLPQILTISASFKALLAGCI